MDVELPLLGVCYGHQLMSHALGGRVDYLPGGREMGTVRITTQGDTSQDALGATLPSVFHAHATHEQSVLELPRDAVSLGRSERGRMGNRRVTVQNLQVVEVLAEKHLLLVRGSVPGAKNGLVMVRRGVKAPE